MPRTGESIEIKSKLVIAKAWRKWEATANHYTVSLQDDENV